MKIKTQPTIGFLMIVVLVAALSRLIPHPHNFAPITGMALAGAAYINRKALAFILPLIALWISDVILNNTIYAASYDGFVLFGEISIWVYASFVAIVALGILVFNKISFTKVFGAALGGSALFFLISNFGVWLTGTMYPKTLTGLAACYSAALPFFQNTIAGDLFYTAIIFGAIELGRRYVPTLYSAS